MILVLDTFEVGYILDENGYSDELRGIRWDTGNLEMQKVMLSSL